jgi:hypothetical protein
MASVSKEKPEWPRRLTLRDTKVSADEGQRIYTTATGHGYEKCEYVRADIAGAFLECLQDILTRPTDPAARQRVRAVIANAEGRPLSRGKDLEPDDCTFLYFKAGGKWKYDGRGRFPRPQHDGWHDVNRDEIIRENGGMPGITSRAADMVVVIVPDESCNVSSAYPRMLKPEVLG